MLELLPAAAKGPIKILKDWTELQLIPDLRVTLFLLPLLCSEWMNNGRDTCGYRCNKNSFYRVLQSMKNLPSTTFGCWIRHPAKQKKRGINTWYYLMGWSLQHKTILRTTGGQNSASLKETVPKSLSLLSIFSPLFHFSFLPLPTICHSPGGPRHS